MLSVFSCHKPCIKKQTYAETTEGLILTPNRACTPLKLNFQCSWHLISDGTVLYCIDIYLQKLIKNDWQKNKGCRLQMPTVNLQVLNFKLISKKNLQITGADPVRLQNTFQLPNWNKLNFKIVLGSSNLMLKH